MRIQSHGDTRSGWPCTVPGTVVHLPLPPSLPSGDLGHIQQNSPVCWTCTAWEVRAKCQAWAALGEAGEGAARAAAGSVLGQRGRPCPPPSLTQETSLSSQYLPRSSLEPECLPSPLSCLPPLALSFCISQSLSFFRSEERRVGKECLRLCRSRWSPYH